MFKTMREGWKFAGYFTDVRKCYAEQCQATGMPPLDIQGLARQRKEEHLFDAFCKECMRLDMPADEAAQLVSMCGYFDPTIPERDRRGELDYEEEAEKTALRMFGSSQADNQASHTQTTGTERVEMVCNGCSSRLTLPSGKQGYVICPKCKERGWYAT